MVSYGLQELHLNKAIAPEDAPLSQHPAKTLKRTRHYKE
jgi:hypothetical protein